MTTGGWRYELNVKAERDMRHLDEVTRRRLFEAFDRLTEEPMRGDIRKLQGRTKEWRLRVGEWRVLFERDEETRLILIQAVRPRSSAYRTS